MPDQRNEQLLEEAAGASNNGDFERALALYSRLLEQIDIQVQEAEGKEHRLRALRERGRLLNLLGDQEAALVAYEQYRREALSDVQVADALIQIGNQARGMGRYQQALSTFQEALRLADALDYQPGRARIYTGMGVTLTLMGRTDQALEDLATALALYEQLGDVRGQAEALNRQGVAHGIRGELDKAIRSFRRSLTLGRFINRPNHIATLLNNLGECHQLLFDHENALLYHREGLAIAEVHRLRLIEADLCRNLGLDLIWLRRPAEGIAYLERAMQTSEATDNLDMELHTLYALALAYLEQDEGERAAPFVERMRELAETTNSRGHLAAALYVDGLCRRGRGDFGTAEEVWQEALFLAHETGKQMLLWQIHAGLASVSERPELARVHRRIAADVIEQIAFPIEDVALRQKFLSAPQIKALLVENQAK